MRATTAELGTLASGLSVQTMLARCWHLCLLASFCLSVQGMQIAQELEHSLDGGSFTSAGRLVGEFITSVGSRGLLMDLSLLDVIASCRPDGHLSLGAMCPDTALTGVLCSPGTAHSSRCWSLSGTACLRAGVLP